MIKKTYTWQTADMFIPSGFGVPCGHVSVVTAAPARRRALGTDARIAADVAVATSLEGPPAWSPPTC